MQIINPKVEILKQIDSSSILNDSSSVEDISKAQGELFENILNHLENCNIILQRDNLKDSVQEGENLDILEHGTVYLTIPVGKPNPGDTEDYMRRMQIVNFYQNDPNSIVKGYKSNEEDVLYVYFITTNYRVIVENNRHTDLIFLFNVSEYHVRRDTYSIITNRYTANKLSKLKYLSVSISDPIVEENNITMVTNSFGENTVAKNSWIDLCKGSYKIYESMINNGSSKSNAYKILPDTVAVNVIITGFNDDFETAIKTLNGEDDVDYCDIIHMIAYDHDNSKIEEEIADEMVEENSEELPNEEAVGSSDIPE